MNKYFWAFFFTLFFVSCSQWTRSPATDHDDQIKHIVFDIDWTITSEVAPSFSGARIIKVEDKKYFVHEGLEEVIEDLLKDDNIKISFFSGGSRLRNRLLLSQIKLRNGKSLEEIAYKVLGKEDLTVVAGVAPNEKFSKRFKKDLTKVSSDLSELFMFDDTEHFVLNEEQEHHVMFLGKTFEHFEHFEDAISSSGEYIPKSFEEWSFSQEKLFIIHGAIRTALEESTNREISFSKAMQIQVRQLNLENSVWNDYSNDMFKYSKKLIRLNLRETSQSGQCSLWLKPYLGL